MTGAWGWLSEPELRRKVLTWQRMAVLVSIAGVAGPLLVSAYRSVVPGAWSRGALILESPRPAEVVDASARVSGRTALRDRRYYIVVTTLQGVDWVQDGRLLPAWNGALTGTAAVGSSQEGVGQQFQIRLLATRSELPAGPLMDLPPDAQFSNSVTVLRSTTPGGGYASH